MKELFVIIAESGEQGIFSVTTYSTHEKAYKNLRGIAKQVVGDFGIDTDDFSIEVGKEGALVTIEGNIVHINIFKTLLNSNNSIVNTHDYQNYYY